MATHRRPYPTRRAALLPLLLALLLALAACGPEDARNRGDGLGSGGDTDNRDSSIQLTGDDARDDRIYLDTPEKLPSTDQPASEGEG